MHTPDAKEKRQHPLSFYYAGLILVIFIWSISPVANPYIYKHISPTVTSTISALVAVLSLIPILGKRLSEIDKRLLKVAIPTGLFNAAASITQKIGLLYTTPSRYAFLENLSCVVVPILMFFFVRQRPSRKKIIAAILCLIGCFLLSGEGFSNGGIGVGELLCAIAGILYGVNIAATGAFATRFYAPLYVFVHMVVSVLTGALSTVLLHCITFNGAPISPAYFEWNLPILVWIVAIALLANTLCWILRTNVMKHLDASVVAVMMPFSAVLTSVFSILLGMDTLTPSLGFGALFVLAATILSGLGDHEKKQKTSKNDNHYLQKQKKSSVKNG